MSKFDWKRELTPAYPNVWLTFKAKDSDSEDLVEYRVQDLPEERFEEAIDHMLTYFVKDEPLCHSRELIKDEVSMAELREIYRDVVQHRLALACFKSGSDEIVGLNMTFLSLLKMKDEKLEVKGKPWHDVYTTVMMITKAIDVFEKYNVDKYMTAFGLSIVPKYRGRGIAKYILRARVPLCQAAGIPLTSTVFTTIASQKPAASANFVDDYEITYAELSSMGPTYDFPGTNQKSIKVMSLVIE